MNMAMTVLGGWLILDGIYSLVKYQQQSVFEQSIRIIRTGIGVTFSIFSFSV